MNEKGGEHEGFFQREPTDDTYLLKYSDSVIRSVFSLCF